MASSRKAKPKPILTGHVQRLRRLAKTDAPAAIKEARALVGAERIIRHYGSLDGLKTTSKRKRKTSVVQSLDCEFRSQGDRDTMVSTVRDLEMNWQLLRGIAGIHCNNVVGTGPHMQVRSKDGEWNDRKEAWFHKWEKTCDIRGILPFSRYVYVLERRTRVDGDIGVNMLKNMKLQAFEAEQIADPPKDKRDERSGVKEGDQLIFGVQTDSALKPKRYHVWSGSGANCRGSGYIGAKPAGNFIHLFDPERFRQSRGLSAFIAAINDNQDLREAFEAIKGTFKLENILGVGIQSAAADIPDADFGFFGKRTDYEINDAEGNEETRKEVKISQGVNILELGEGESVQTIEKRTPGGNFEPWSMLQIRMAALAFHMPLELAFMFFTRGSFSSLKGAIGQYHQVVTIDRQRLETQLLNRIQAWVTRAGIKLWASTQGQRGLEPPPEEIDPVDTEWEWDSLPLLEPDKKIDADIKEYKAGVTSLTAIAARRNRDLEKVTIERARELKRIREIAEEEEVDPEELLPQVGVPGEPMPEPNTGGNGDDD